MAVPWRSTRPTPRRSMLCQRRLPGRAEECLILKDGFAAKVKEMGRK